VIVCGENRCHSGGTEILLSWRGLSTPLTYNLQQTHSPTYIPPKTGAFDQRLKNKHTQNTHRVLIHETETTPILWFRFQRSCVGPGWVRYRVENGRNETGDRVEGEVGIDQGQPKVEVRLELVAFTAKLELGLIQANNKQNSNLNTSTP
jgi:hypothetical protein